MATAGWEHGPGELAHPHWSGLPRWSRSVLGATLQVWTLSPWVALAYAGAAVAVHRWPGAVGHASAALCAVAAWTGWRLLWRAAVREMDVTVAGNILAAQVPDPAPWALFPQREELVKLAHWRRCLCRHGVNPRSSGWALLVTSARGGLAPLFAGLGWVALAVHPWWL